MWPSAPKESSCNQVASTVYRRVGGQSGGGILAAAIWQNQPLISAQSQRKNVAHPTEQQQRPTPPLVRRLKRQKEQNTTPLIESPTNQALKIVKKVALSIVMGMYVIHPVIMLWLFRSPELFSLLGIFQTYHKCSGTLTRSWNACFQYAATNVFLYIPSFGGIWLWLQSKFSLSRKLLITFSCLLGFKIAVDHAFLFHIPSNTNLEGKVAVITGANR
jgi:hypothetical protein